MDSPAAVPLNPLFMTMLMTHEKNPSLQANTEQARANNFRDATTAADATPYRNQAGQPLQSGVFYRSSALGLQALATPAWQQLGLATVYDLRTPSEVQAQPDPVPEAVRYQHVNVLDMDHVLFGSLESPQQTVAFMEALQRKMVTEPSIRQGFATVLTQMAQESGAQLYHCSGGKDRTGWVSVLLLSHAGVSTDTVMEDYLLSNQRLSAFVDQTYEAIAQRQGQKAADAIRPALTVQESFLNAGLEQIQTSFGSIDHYLQQGLGLTPEILAQLRHKLLGD